MDSVASKLDLRERGTRFDHYMELKELFMLGIEVLANMKRGNISEADRKMKVKLEAAVELIGKRIELLADYGTKVYAVNREIESAGVHRTLLAEGDKTNEGI